MISLIADTGHNYRSGGQESWKDSICHSLYLIPLLPQSPPLTISMSFTLSLSISMSFTLSLSLSLSISISFTLYLSIPISFSLSHTISFTLSLSFSLSLFLYPYLFLYLSPLPLSWADGSKLARPTGCPSRHDHPC